MNKIKKGLEIGKMKNTAVFISYGMMVHPEVLNMTLMPTNSSDINQLLPIVYFHKLLPFIHILF